MEVAAVMTIVSARKDTQEHIVDSLSVKMGALMEGDVWLQTDVLVHTVSLDLSVKEIIGLARASHW